MSLPVPNLDDYHFQAIVDEAKRRIPYFCPEWTDHNVSDPGVALIELFAWMTDMLLYRVNQVPDKMYVTFLDLIGVRLEEPSPARAPVTFYLSAPQPNDVMIPKDTEVATARTETTPAIIFTTEQDFTIRPAVVAGAFTRDRSREGGSGWTPRDLERLKLPDKHPDKHIDIFPPDPGVGDAFYLPLECDHSQHVLALVLDCDEAAGAGIDPRKPPWEWQVWQGGLTRWATCDVEFDGTGGFNWAGDIILHLPAMAKAKIAGPTERYWLRCVLTQAQASDGGYEESPKIKAMSVESRGGTIGARNAVTVLNEVLGVSEGKPGQTYALLNKQLLARDADHDYLVVEPPNQHAEPWQEVSDFADSGPEDHHYVLDSRAGLLLFGPELPQPSGAVYRFGAVPPKNSLLRFSRYQHGGGVDGNVPAYALSALMSSIPYVARVTNRAEATGGQNAQSLEDAKLRAPQALRTRTRAVTANDYEYLASTIGGVARARCLGPGDLPDLAPGHVRVLLVPEANTPRGRIAQGALTLSADLLDTVKRQLDELKPLGIALDIRQATYMWVSIQARLSVPERSNPALAAEVRRQAEDALYGYVNPYSGGPQEQGWPFDRDLHVSEIYALLQRIPGVEFVEDVQIVLPDGGGPGKPQVVAPRLAVPPDAIICSAEHQVTVN